MYVLVVEKRISAQIKDRGRSAPDWYVLLAIALPFEPSVGFEIQLKGKSTTKLTRVIYNPNNGTFWARVPPILHPKPDAQKVAQNLVDVVGWDIAMEESTLAAATVTLRNKAVEKLQSMLMKAQSKIIGGQGPVRLAFDPRGPGRKH